MVCTAVLTRESDDVGFTQSIKVADCRLAMSEIVAMRALAKRLPCLSFVAIVGPRYSLLFDIAIESPYHHFMSKPTAARSLHAV